MDGKGGHSLLGRLSDANILTRTTGSGSMKNAYTIPGSWFIQRQRRIGDTIPPVPPVLRSLFNLVPADAHFQEIFLDDIFQFCRGRPGLLVKPSGSHMRAPQALKPTVNGRINI